MYPVKPPVGNIPNRGFVFFLSLTSLQDCDFNQYFRIEEIGNLHLLMPVLRKQCLWIDLIRHAIEEFADFGEHEGMGFELDPGFPCLAWERADDG